MPTLRNLGKRECASNGLDAATRFKRDDGTCEILSGLYGGLLRLYVKVYLKQRRRGKLEMGSRRKPKTGNLVRTALRIDGTWGNRSMRITCISFKRVGFRLGDVYGFLLLNEMQKGRSTLRVAFLGMHCCLQPMSYQPGEKTLQTY